MIGPSSGWYLFFNWSDSGAQSHSVTAPSSVATYTANFTTQYYLTTSVGTGGTINPASGWYNSGAVAPVSATPTSGYQFTGFSGSLSGTTSPQNLAMNAPASVAANFTTPPTSVSVFPSSGSGSAQTFTFTFSDPSGGANIRSTQMDIGAALAQPGTCYLFYDRGGHAIYLGNDAGATGAAYPLGVAGTTSNSQCTVDAGASSATTSGNNLTINLALTFKPAFAGAKNVYAMADNGVPSAWVQLGTWTVPTAGDFTVGVAPTTQIGLISPPGGPPINYTYTVTTTASGGFSGTEVFSTNLASGFQPTFNPPSVTGSGTTTLTLAIPAGTAPGTVTQFTITATSGSVVHSANASVTADSAPSPDSVTPSSGSGSAQTFTFVFSDAQGAADIDGMQLLFANTSGATSGYANACNIWISPRASQSNISLKDDPALIWASATAGQAGTLHNSQCSVDSAPSSIVASGNTVTVTLAITFQPAFAGTHNITMEAVDVEGLGVGLPPTRGTWTVPVVVQPDFSISVSPTSQAGVGGGTVPYTVSTAFLNGFNSTVTFSVSGLPAGVSGTFSPPSITAPGPTTLTLSISAGAAGGTFTISGTGGGLTRSVPASVTVPSPITILTNPYLPSGTLGQPYSQCLAATGGQPAYTWWISGPGLGPLPPGLTLSANGACAGVVGGTVGGYAQPYIFNIKVSDSAGQVAIQTFVMTVAQAPAPLSITTSSLPAAPIGTGYAIQFAGTGGIGSYNWSISGQAPGISVSSGPLGMVSGTPTAVGNYSFNAQLTDSLGQTTSRAFNLTVSGSSAADYAITVPQPAQVGTVGGPVKYTVNLTSLNNFTGTVTLSLTGLPTGVTGSFSPPTVPVSGSSQLTLNIAPGAASGSFTITTDGTLPHSVSASITIETAPAVPSKEYIRLGNRVIAIENH